MYKKVGELNSRLGRVLVSTKNIPAGTQIFKDSPIISISNPSVPIELKKYLDDPQNQENNLLNQLQADHFLKFTPFKFNLTKNATKWTRLTHPDSTAIHKSVVEKFAKILFLNGWKNNGEIAIYPNATFLAHSCKPNVVISQSQSNITVTAPNDIQEEQVLSASYLPPFYLILPTHLRRARLADTKAFLCQCPRCTAKLDDTRIYNSSIFEIEDAESASIQAATVTPSDYGLTAVHEKRTKSMLYRVYSDLCTKKYDDSALKTAFFDSRTTDTEVAPNAKGIELLQLESQLEKKISELYMSLEHKYEQLRPEVFELRQTVENLVESGLLNRQHWIFSATAWLRLIATKKCEINELAKLIMASSEGNKTESQARMEAREAIFDRIRNDAETVCLALKLCAGYTPEMVSQVLSGSLPDMTAARVASSSLRAGVEQQQSGDTEAASQKVQELVSQGMTMEDAVQTVMAEYAGEDDEEMAKKIQERKSKSRSAL